MTPERIKTIRTTLGETVEVFAARFSRSGRTVEDWEQGRRIPDPLVIAMLTTLEVSQKKTSKKSRKKTTQA